MKNLILLLALSLLAPSISQAQNIVDSITCAVNKKYTGSQVSTRDKAVNVLVFSRVSDSFFGLKEYTSYDEPTYEETFQGPGLIYSAQFNSDGSIDLVRVNSSRTLKITENMNLRVDKTTGSYPGASPAPKRTWEYNCIEDYKHIEYTTRDEVIRDFEL